MIWAYSEGIINTLEPYLGPPGVQWVQGTKSLQIALYHVQLLAEAEFKTDRHHHPGRKEGGEQIARKDRIVADCG